MLARWGRSSTVRVLLRTLPSRAHLHHARAPGPKRQDAPRPRRPRPKPLAPVELTTKPRVLAPAELERLLTEAVEAYAQSSSSVKRLEEWGFSLVALNLLCHSLARTTDAAPHTTPAEAWRWLLQAWAQSLPTHNLHTFPSVTERIAAYTQQGDDALHRACAQSFLSWLRRAWHNLRAHAELSASSQSHAREAAVHVELIQTITNLRTPTLAYSHARSLTRQIHLHVGPTNSGKTHGALVALTRARTGLYAGPLRLLAHEVWDRINHGAVAPDIAPRACNLRTGEELRVVDEYAGLVSCTVEMADVTRSYDVAVIDEIQMIADPQRGFAWTQAVLGLPAKELHLCGEASAVPLIRRLVDLCGDELHVHEYERLTPLRVAPQSLRGDLSRVERGDCVVAFSRSGIFALKEMIEAKTGLHCAVAYGALPPETKSEQAKLFNAGKLDVMVASDAIGMGLNLKIKRVIFDTLSKWNGTERVPLSLSQIKQIAGRAGRYGTARDAETPGGFVLTRHEDEMDTLRAALAAPVRPITHASIQPMSRQLEDLSLLLPRVRTRAKHRRLKSRQDYAVSTLYDDFHALANVDARAFTLADFDTQQAMSPIIEQRGGDRLTHAEKEKWSNTPVNMRDERAVAWVGHAIELYARGELVEFEACARHLGTIEAEQAVADTMAAAQAKRDAAGSTAPAAVFAEDDENVLSIHTLMLLESLHRTLTLA
ncbi:RNA helicase [Malassezia caprae]|uniref:ATP-dependent RNA helicase SUV3, mitochondrial n=1 Tax=Malassezia caprae TaxID=1381934 RepID=A0AAF0E8F4_9BASI|nr:RNA helicase [Malassezia caprae]